MPVHVKKSPAVEVDSQCWLKLVSLLESLLTRLIFFKSSVRPNSQTLVDPLVVTAPKKPRLVERPKRCLGNLVSGGTVRMPTF